MSQKEANKVTKNFVEAFWAEQTFQYGIEYQSFS
jgi:hypothetical protein